MLMKHCLLPLAFHKAEATSGRHIPQFHSCPSSWFQITSTIQTGLIKGRLHEAETKNTNCIKCWKLLAFILLITWSLSKTYLNIIIHHLWWQFVYNKAHLWHVQTNRPVDCQPPQKNTLFNNIKILRMLCTSFFSSHI